MVGPVGVQSLLDRLRIVLVIDLAVVKKGIARAGRPPLPYVNVPSARSFWCWAAVAYGVSHSYDATSTWEQCEIAAEVYPDKSCCVPPPPGDVHSCNCAAFLSAALTTVGCYHDRAAALFGVATGEIDANKVLPIHISWPPDDDGNVTGHYTVVHGYTTTADEDALVIADPLYNVHQVPLSAMYGFYVANGTWDDSYLTDGQIV
jgi:hypothetical protein